MPQMRRKRSLALVGTALNWAEPIARAIPKPDDRHHLWLTAVRAINVEQTVASDNRASTPVAVGSPSPCDRHLPDNQSGSTLTWRSPPHAPGPVPAKSWGGMGVFLRRCRLRSMSVVISFRTAGMVGAYPSIKWPSAASG